MVDGKLVAMPMPEKGDEHVRKIFAKVLDDLKRDVEPELLAFGIVVIYGPETDYSTATVYNAGRYYFTLRGGVQELHDRIRDEDKPDGEQGYV